MTNTNKLIEAATQDLFYHMLQEHGVTLLESEVRDLVVLCRAIDAANVPSHREYPEEITISLPVASQSEPIGEIV